MRIIFIPDKNLSWLYKPKTSRFKSNYQIINSTVSSIKKQNESIIGGTTLVPGFQQLFAKILNRQHIPYKVFAPYWGVELGWNKNNTKLFKELSKQAEEFIYCYTGPMEPKAHYRTALNALTYWVIQDKYRIITDIKDHNSKLISFNKSNIIRVNLQ